MRLGNSVHMVHMALGRRPGADRRPGDYVAHRCSSSAQLCWDDGSAPCDRPYAGDWPCAEDWAALNDPALNGAALGGPRAVLVIGGDGVIDEVLGRLDLVTVWDDGRTALWAPLQKDHHQVPGQLSFLDASAEDDFTGGGRWYA